MKMRKIKLEQNELPERYAQYFLDSEVYDSSSSPEARVYYSPKNRGVFLKKSSKGSLYREAVMTKYFASKSLAPEVLDYYSADNDWLLTVKGTGLDCTSPVYMEDPIKLVSIVAEVMLDMHGIDYSDCPVQNRTAEYLETFENNRKNQIFNKDFVFLGNQFHTPDEAFSFISERTGTLENSALVHGDFCLPNILLDNWNFGSLIDLGFSGVGDRHIDIFWAIWSFGFNFGTDKFADMIIDAYGRERVDLDRLRLIAAIECFG